MRIATDYIVRTPGVCGGKARLAGHRIRVQDIAFWHERLGMSADEIVSEYPGLTLAKVYSALAYYYDHRDEIAQEIRADRNLIKRSRRLFPSLLEEKIRG
ncbi:MAG: DUF433 domain-containing protein [Candidatus Hydrogenedentes bacterium]|nr:DUF433 domain-containing protein [Candidatus Hydrogenedentota bacterium]